VPLAVLLSGEHPTLPAAELRALLDVHDPLARMHTSGLVVHVERGRREGGAEAAVGRMALAHAWGQSWGDAPDTEDGLAWLCERVRERADGKGSIAVATERRGVARTMASRDIEHRLGAALAAAGHTINLAAPDRVCFAWVMDGRIRAGELLGRTDRSAFEARVGDRRAHFSPVSLHPRRAAALLHLARAVPGATVYDPFCGTGAFVLEAALEGYKAMASDLDAFMVQGTLQTLTDVPAEPLDVAAFVADIGDAPDLAGPVDAIVTDLPYGRSSGTDGEAVDLLYRRTMASIARLLRPGAHAVLGCARPELLDGWEAHGLAVVEHHSDAVHRSLTRHFIVVKRVAAVADAS